MDKHSLIQTYVKQGDKITVVTQGEFGGLSVIPMIFLQSVPAVPYLYAPEQDSGVKIYFKPKGKRNPYTMTIEKCVPLIVYKGYINIDAEAILYRQCGNCKFSKYGMHDPRYFDDTLKAYPKSVLFFDIPNRQE